MMRFLVLTMFLLAISSCNNFDNKVHQVLEVIDLSEPKEGKSLLSTITNDIEYVKLETTESSLVGRIEQIIINEAGIFVQENQRLLHFDLNGRYLKDIGKSGRGPGEFNVLQDIYIDVKHSLIYLKQSNLILVYSIDGDFLFSKKDTTRKRLLSKLNDNQFLFLYEWPLFMNNDFSIETTDSLFQTSGKLLNRGWVQTNTEDVNYGNSGWCELDYFVDSLTYWENRSDTVYRITENAELIPRYIIKRNNKPPFNAPSEDIYNMKYHMIAKYMETDNFIFFPQVVEPEGKGAYFILYEKSAKRVSYIKHNNTQWHKDKSIIGFKNDIDYGWYFYPEGITSTGKPFSYFSGVDLKNVLYPKTDSILNSSKSSPIIWELIKNSSQNDNPIIMILNNG